MYSIMIIDDQPSILAGLKSLVDSTGIAQVVATETDPGVAMSTALKLRPDMILLDVSLGDASGVDFANELLAQWQDARVLAVSAHADSVYVRSMVNVGASGYMLKEHGPAELTRAIETIMDGGQWIGTGLAFNPA